MNTEEKILDLFDDYFKSASAEEIARDVAFVNSIGTNGITLEEYLDNLNHSTSYTLVDNGICDDIAFADMFNNAIQKIQMGNDEFVKMGDLFEYQPKAITENFGISTYAFAA